jgi:hypothetical protein
MKFRAMRLWMPLAALGAVLAFAPQSRAQADVSPDHFDENGIASDFGHAKTSPSNAKTTPAAPAVAQNQKSNAKAKPQTVSGKESATVRQNLVAVNDKSKVPPRKKNDQQ